MIVLGTSPYLTGSFVRKSDCTDIYNTASSQEGLFSIYYDHEECDCSLNISDAFAQYFCYSDESKLVVRNTTDVVTDYY